MQIQEKEFIQRIKENLEEKIRKNPQYSLRSYAKQLGVSPATLSRILNGKRQLSAESLGKMGFAMGFKPEEVWQYQRQALGHKENATQSEFKELSQDMFVIVSEWYHLTLLEVMKLKDFKPDSRWIAQRLHINVYQVKIAIERLQRVGILEIQKDGKWIDKMEGFTTHYQKDKTNDARKRYQRQLLEKSLESLQQDDYSIRDHSSTTMAIDVGDIMKAKEEIHNFHKKLSGLLEKSKKTNEVYQLQVSLFPLTNKLPDDQKNKPRGH